MSNTAPLTNRPQTAADLRFQYQLEPVTIMQKPDYDDQPDLARWWGSVLSTAMDVPGLTVNGSSIVRPFTDDEIAEKVRNEQEDYDRGRDLYQKWLDEGEYPSWNHKWSDYLYYEGIETPERPEGDNTDD